MVSQKKKMKTFYFYQNSSDKNIESFLESKLIKDKINLQIKDSKLNLSAFDGKKRIEDTHYNIIDLSNDISKKSEMGNAILDEIKQKKNIISNYDNFLSEKEKEIDDRIMEISELKKKKKINKESIHKIGNKKSLIITKEGIQSKKRTPNVAPQSMAPVKAFTYKLNANKS